MLIRPVEEALRALAGDGVRQALFRQYPCRGIEDAAEKTLKGLPVLRRDSVKLSVEDPGHEKFSLGELDGPFKVGPGLLHVSAKETGSSSEVGPKEEVGPAILVGLIQFNDLAHEGLDPRQAGQGFRGVQT